MHCSRLVWNRTAEIKYGLRPNFGLRPKLSVTLLYALIRSQTGCLVSDQGLRLWFQWKIKWPNARVSVPLFFYRKYVITQITVLDPIIAARFANARTWVVAISFIPVTHETETSWLRLQSREANRRSQKWISLSLPLHTTSSIISRPLPPP